ncbi:arabinofuranosyltransferase [Pseudonocardia endophytica]|uniref:Galactan 5-O-arabinofuranosyltransferase n=1 Tax=Pseudonocardia endophytica TaxID=401976 RepID=A0A4V2PJ68_PSEEN|nr:arabinofuranosyltransferase [Pseudonocardia endophytica]TCK27376.1 galactan 5-O-arabinofuranosyltransferase [Pseudonocardia endophytica]
MTGSATHPRVRSPIPAGQRRRPAAALSWLEPVAAVVVAVLVSAVAQLVVSRLPIPAGTNVGLALTSSSGLLVALVLAASGMLARRPALAAPLAWAGLSALATLPVALLLSGTRHYIFGISGDQAFRVEFLTRFADSARLADVAYADLPPYYPAGWFWVGGRLASLFGVEAWAFYKPFALTSMAVTAVLAYLLWTRVTSRTRALGAAVATVLAGVATTAAYTPYSWLTAALVAPAAVLGVRLVDAACDGRRPPVGSAVAVGLVLGVAAVTHTQIAAFGVFVLGVAGLGGLVRSRGRALVRLVIAAGIVAIAAVPLVLVFWTPYWLARLGGASGSDAAQRFLPESGAQFPLPMFSATPLGVLALAGTVWIVLRWRTDPVARGLGITAACGYAWYLLSTLALVADTTLLSFRLEPIVTAALACGSVGAAADVVRLVRDRLPVAPGLAPQLPVLAVVLAVAVVVGQVQATPKDYDWSRSAQASDRYPDGTSPTGAAPTPGSVAELAGAIDGMTGRPRDQVVVLSSTYSLLTYEPYRTYLTTIAQYSNPIADFAGRRDRVLAWSASRTPAELLAALDAAPERPPSVFVLQRGDDGLLRMGLTYDPFPAQSQRSVTATFDPRVFDDPAFVRRDVGPYAVIVRTDAPPVG